MTDDTYRAIISISHHRIAFEYWQRFGEDKLVGMPPAHWPAPLAFYCSPTGIVIGEEALRAVQAGAPNAFVDYFNLLVENTTYSIGNRQQPIGNLLLEATEQIFRDFYSRILFGRYGSLNENRANMPLTIVCEADIKPNEKAYLKTIFADSGYSRVEAVDYDDYIEQYIRRSLSKQYDCDKVLVAWVEGPDLTLTLFDINGQPRKETTFKGLGIDPRIKYVKDLIWESVIGENPYLIREDEDSAIGMAAFKFLSSNEPLVEDYVVLSDGFRYRYSLLRNNIDFIQSPEGEMLQRKLTQFLNECKVDNRRRILLLLRGNAANNTYFEQNLSQGFGSTVKSDNNLRQSTMALILSEPAGSVAKTDIAPKAASSPSRFEPESKNSEKELAKQWREVKATASGKARGGDTKGAIEILMPFLEECRNNNSQLVEKVEAEINKFGSTNVQEPQPKTAPKGDIPALRREWREVKALASAKLRSNNSTEARVILDTFLKKVVNICDQSLIEKVKSAIEALPATTPLIEPKPQRSSAYPKKEVVKKVEEAASTDVAEALIAAGKLSEARDWYRDHGNQSKAKILTDIIRKKRGVDLRKNDLENCKKSKNSTQIARIIQELEEYIGLCSNVGIPASDIKKLVSDFKHIK